MNRFSYYIIQIYFKDFMQDSKIKDLQEDGGFSFSTFGNLLVFIFYSQASEQSKKFLQNINNSISVFGQYDNVLYYSLPAEKCPQTFNQFKVEKVPTVVLTQTDRKVIQRYDGNDIGSIFDLIDRVSQEHKAKFQKDKAVWYHKIQSLIESCPFLVFIVGTPENPMCGFTRRLMEIFKNHKIQYAYYDIMSDSQIVSWLKHYSKWPTFPQLFINGKLVGGLDVTKELVQKGEFQKMIPESCKQSPADERYKKFIEEHETIVFIDGFAFQNKSSETAIEEAHKKFGEKVTIYNVAIESTLKNYILQNISKEVPFTVHNKQISKN